MKTQGNSQVIANRSLETDFVVVGGGLAGVCAALAAARHGARVILVQDRPMLGGNASSEIRMGIMGAHGNHNKETGLLEELQLDNIRHNPLMRYTLWDDILLSALIREPNITPLFNTSVDAVEADQGRIVAVSGWNTEEYCRYRLAGRMFADCSGDGILRLSGAEFRIGRETPEEFGEDFTQVGGDDRTMGSSILMQLRKTDTHRPYRAPEWAYHFTEETIPKHRNLYPENNNFWWIEYGGQVDTIADAGAIGHELKRIAYGVWEYIKNHPDGRGREYELDWIGSLAGKRESCRFVGDVLLNQHDIMGGGRFPDVVAHGGWSLDDHHPEGFFRSGEQSIHHFPPSPFGIPYRALYSANIGNLLFAGRNVSCTHMGMSATRVMATCAVMGQAVGTAAALALRHGCGPRDVHDRHLGELQQTLLEDDQLLPGVAREIPGATLRAAASHEALRSGHERDGENVSHGVWLDKGRSAEYRWSEPETVSGARIVFDTELSHQGKRMRKLEATTEYKEPPAMLCRAFRIEGEVDGRWRTLAAETDNHHRLWRCRFEPARVSAARLVVEESWGDSPVRVFSWDMR